MSAPSLSAMTMMLRAGETDLIAFLDAICDRIEADEPRIQAFLPEPDRRARLLHDATNLRAMYPDPKSRPPLYGIPVAVKDIVCVDGFETRAGSLLPPELFAGPEAACVRALRRAGGLILGKAVTTEFAYFEPGPTRNPRNLEHTPGGSSSGSAAAVAAGFCPLALGSQTVGSTIRPAAFCGVVGFKPSYGRISTDGWIPFSESADHVGLFATDVEGMELAAAVLCASWQTATPSMLPTLGVPDGPYLQKASAEAMPAFESQLKRLEQAGFRVRRAPMFEDFDAITRRHTRMIAAEMSRVHAEWFPRYETRYRPRTAALIREGRGVSGGELAAARAGRFRLRAELESAMTRNGIDLWVCPAATGPAPAGLASTGDPVMNLPWTHAGLPAVTVPAGKASNGLPLGLQCVAAHMADEHLLAWARRIATFVDG
ncbi:MAG: amidase [Verrucomicrobia bacterium]|nr:amidase [Verrucomicrobiota bacterium]